MRPTHHSHNFCSPIFLAETFGRRALPRPRNQISDRGSKKERRVGLKTTGKLSKPVWDVNVDDAGFQELPLLVSTGHQEPPLVVGQAVTHEEHVAFGRKFCPDLPLFRLFGTGRTEDEGGRVDLQRVRVLKNKINGVMLKM